MFVKSYSPAAVQLDFSFFVFPTAPIAVLDDFILYLDGWFLFFIFSNCTRRHSWKFLPESLNKTDIFPVHFTSNSLYLPPKRRQCLPKDTKKLLCRYLRGRVCQDTFCGFSKLNDLSVKKSPKTSCLQMS